MSRLDCSLMDSLSVTQIYNQITEKYIKTITTSSSLFISNFFVIIYFFQLSVIKFLYPRESILVSASIYKYFLLHFANHFAFTYYYSQISLFKLSSPIFTQKMLLSYVILSHIYIYHKNSFLQFTAEHKLLLKREVLAYYVHQVGLTS